MMYFEENIQKPSLSVVQNDRAKVADDLSSKINMGNKVCRSRRSQHFSSNELGIDLARVSLSELVSSDTFRIGDRHDGPIF